MKSYSILLVDDYPEVLAVVCDALVRKGYQVKTATGGSAAIEALRADDFDLVITDLNMPDMDGLAVLKKAKELNSDCGVMIMTGNSTVATAINALRLGADDYLLKPFLMTALWNRVASCLERSETRRQARGNPNHHTSQLLFP